MSISAELQEAAIYMGAKAYLRGCFTDPDGWTAEQEDLAKRIAAYRPEGSNAVRAACIAVLEYMDLRSKDACVECSGAHWCFSCGERATHRLEALKIRCENCRNVKAA